MVVVFRERSPLLSAMEIVCPSHCGSLRTGAASGHHGERYPLRTPRGMDCSEHAPCRRRSCSPAQRTSTQWTSASRASHFSTFSGVHHDVLRGVVLGRDGRGTKEGIFSYLLLGTQGAEAQLTSFLVLVCFNKFGMIFVEAFS